MSKLPLPLLGGGGGEFLPLLLGCLLPYVMGGVQGVAYNEMNSSKFSLHTVSRQTYSGLSIRISWIGRMDAFHSARLHGDDAAGDSPQAGTPTDDSLGPVTEGFHKGALVKETVLKLRPTWRQARPAAVK